MQISDAITNVMFMDIKGFSRLSTEHGPKFLGTVIEPAADLVRKYEIGYVNTWGDAITGCQNNIRKMCLFCLDMRDLFKNTDWKEAHLPPLEARISIHQGRILVGDSPFTEHGWIFGETIVRSARIEPITEPGQIWVTSEIALAVGREEDFPGKVDRLGSFELAKGAGSEELYLLKRPNETPLLPSTRLRLLERFSEIHDRKLSVHSIAIGVVTKGDQVLLVKRRNSTLSTSWMFPHAVIDHTDEPEVEIWQEIHNETGFITKVLGKIGQRTHPESEKDCHYFHLEAISGTLQNNDPIENERVEWVGFSKARNRLGDSVFELVQPYLS